jgi:hypothetical protein
MKPLLELMRIFHAILGITPAEPERERAYLLLWIGVFALIIVVIAACVFLLVPRIMH